MAQWKIRYAAPKNCSIEKWLDALSKEEFRSIFKELKLLELCGNELRLPHSKSLGKGLFELRERNYGLRVYYVFFSQKVILIVQVGNKQTQKKDIEKAYTILKTLKNSKEI